MLVSDRPLRCVGAADRLLGAYVVVAGPSPALFWVNKGSLCGGAFTLCIAGERSGGEQGAGGRLESKWWKRGGLEGRGEAELCRQEDRGAQQSSAWGSAPGTPLLSKGISEPLGCGSTQRTVWGERAERLQPPPSRDSAWQGTKQPGTRIFYPRGRLQHGSGCVRS